MKAFKETTQPGDEAKRMQDLGILNTKKTSNSLLRISIEGPPLNEFEFVEAVALWALKEKINKSRLNNVFVITVKCFSGDICH